MENLQVYMNSLGCGTGYYSVYPDPVSCECEICVKGTYNDKDSVQSCTSCPTGWTTPQQGATSITTCKQSKNFNHFYANYCAKLSLEG